MFFVTLANPLTILLFYGYAAAAAGAHRHWLLGAACVFAGSLVGQLVFAFGGSAIARVVKSPRWLAASHVLAALVVLVMASRGSSARSGPGRSSKPRPLKNACMPWHAAS
jgi:hypothetical protein